MKLILQEESTMKKLGIAVLVLALPLVSLGAEDVVTAVHGTVTKIDKTGKTVAIKTADGTEHTLHWGKDTIVHGAKGTDVAAKDSWHGLKEGTEVVAHATKRGTEDTVVEVDKIGDEGVKKTEGTIKEIDRGGKKLVIKTADGTEHTFVLTGHATADAGKDIGEGSEKGAKVVVYSTEHAGKKVAHFFEKL
ncbi:MAG TPA: hypothetical protein VKP58_15295 [Candidatus Acidoferrum sp.]|nr:hypothetical protein [Candidatus Acidoferrum sp.]